MLAPGSLAVNLLALAAAYLIGSVSFAVVVSRLMGLADPHTYGSGNPGATNVLRTGNRRAAVLTLLGDVLKGVAAVLLAKALAPDLGLSTLTVMGVGLAAFLGHVWPVFFRFEGGKGVATTAAVLMGLNPWLGVATLATFGIIVVFFRYVSLASIVAAVFAPFYQLLIWGGGVTFLALVPMCLILVWRHQGNIKKLMSGTESKLGQKVPPAQAMPHAKDHHHTHHASHSKTRHKGHH